MLLPVRCVTILSTSASPDKLLVSPRLQIVVSQVRYIPIPRIEHNDENIHIIVENIILTSDNFLPNVMEIKMKNAAVVGLRSELASQTATSVTLNFYQIYADIRDVPFFFRKKTGFPKLQDHGVANIFVSRRKTFLLIVYLLTPLFSSPLCSSAVKACPLSLSSASTCHLASAPSGSASARPTSTTCALRSASRGMSGSLPLFPLHSPSNPSQSPLYRAAAPIIDGAVRRAIQTTVETQVRDWVGYLDSQITGLKTSTAQAAAAGKPMQEATLNRFLVGFGRLAQ